VRHRAVTIVLGLLPALAGCDDIGRHYAGGASGHSFLVADQFVILRNGYRRGEVTWVVVRNWPVQSTAEQRLSDGRLVLGTDGEFRVRQGAGELRRPEPGMAYIFDGDRVTTFPIRMREEDFVSFRPEHLKTYPEVEDFLRRFERGPGS